MSIFIKKNFISHSGNALKWKFEADDLDDQCLEALAFIVSEKLSFSAVHGIPRGGQRFAEHLEKYCSESGGLLIVDDVLTTGRSMEEARNQFGSKYPSTKGVVIFNRSVQAPNWVWPLLNLGQLYI